MSQPQQIDKIFPSTFDEPPTNVKLYGRSEVEYVKLDGWTKSIPLEFLGLKKDLIIKTITSQMDPKVTPRGLHTALNNTVTLKAVSSKAGTVYAPMPCAVLVRVLAKKRLDPYIKEKSLLLFGTIIVGDDTGFCQLDVANDAIGTLYQQVSIGDCLFISRATIRDLIPRDADENPQCLDPKKFLNLQMKITAFNCRNVLKIQRQIKPFPSCYMSKRKFFNVSDLLTPSLKTCKSLEGEGKYCYFDIIGVISHVGRAERYQEIHGELILSNSQETIKIYRTHQFIELVDMNSQSSIPIQLFLNQNTWEMQSKIIPGSLIIITNVLRKEDMYSPKVCSSRFSHVFINGDIRLYFQYLPDNFRKIITPFFGFSSGKSIFTKNNVKFTIGGSYSTPIEDEDVFKQYFDKRTRGDEPTVPTHVKDLLLENLDFPHLALRKRETKRIIFHGFFKKYRKVPQDIHSEFVKNSNKEMRIKCNTNYREFRTSELLNPVRNWYMFSHVLPVIDINRLQVQAQTMQSNKDNNDVQNMSTQTGIYEYISNEYKKYCTGLAIPATNVSDLKGLPIHDLSKESPGFLLQIVNTDLDPNEQYLCIWKSSKFLSFEQMEVKLKQAINSNRASFIVDIHYIDDGTKGEKVVEIILQDFSIINQNVDVEMQNVDADDNYVAAVEELSVHSQEEDPVGPEPENDLNRNVENGLPTIIVDIVPENNLSS